MEELFNKIKVLRDMLKAIAPKLPERPLPQALPSIKTPTPPSMNTKPSAPKLQGVSPDSKKDPKKIAEQLKSGQVKAAKATSMLKYDKNGQWSI